MYKGKMLEQSSIIHKSFSSSLLNESTNQVIERQIDNYTRLLEQDKRRFFRVQENRNEVAKEHSKKIKQLDLLKSRQFSNEMFKMKGKLKILENQLDQAINSYNNVIASNKRLKGQIDELRKEKLNQKEVMRKITCRIEEYAGLLAQSQEELDTQKASIEQNKQEIMAIKVQNQSEAKMFRVEVSSVQANLASSKAGSQLLKRKSQLQTKKEGTDTQPLVRYRLRHLLLKNKERTKIIDSYRKTMEAIWKSFEQIKQESGIGDLEEITSTFLKHQQQNHFIYQYIDKLNRDIQDLNDNIETLETKIEEQKEMNRIYQQEVGDTPKKQLARMASQKFQQKCEKSIAQLDNFLRLADPELKEMGEDQELTRFNLTQVLAKLEQMIDLNFTAKEDLSGTFHEEATRYTKGPPGYLDQVKDCRQQKLLDADKLREFATDFWQKRRAKPQVK